MKVWIGRMNGGEMGAVEDGFLMGNGLMRK